MTPLIQFSLFILIVLAGIAIIQSFDEARERQFLISYQAVSEDGRSIDYGTHWVQIQHGRHFNADSVKRSIAEDCACPFERVSFTNVYEFETDSDFEQYTNIDIKDKTDGNR